MLLPTVSDAQLSRRISEMLSDLGLLPVTKGFFYISEAVALYVLSPDPLNIRLMDDIYPFIANKYKSTPKNIERNIRYTVKELFDRKPTKTFSRLFGETRPSNGELFLACAYEVLQKLRDERL